VKSLNGRERFLAACAGTELDYPPVWFMRQAGRALPEYRALRQKHDFLELVHTPELAAEVTLQPVRRFRFDAAILFSDILVIPEALGQKFRFREKNTDGTGGGIEMEFAIRSEAQIHALDVAGIAEKLGYATDALRLVRRELGDKTALIGFAGSPWTLACYMVEGGGVANTGAPHLLALADEQPAAFELLMGKLSDAVADFLLMQIAAGADAVQIFDSWAALADSGIETNAGVETNSNSYKKLSQRWMSKVISRLNAERTSTAPIIVFAKGVAHRVADIAHDGANVVSVDDTRPLSVVRRALDDAGLLSTGIQGNLSSDVPDGSPEAAAAGTRAVLADIALPCSARSRRHIFNLSHGLHPNARLETISAIIETVRTPLAAGS
jgi:uroporphyrinogen decarboxylase